MSLWGYVSNDLGTQGLGRWLSWAVPVDWSRLEEGGQDQARHLWSILNAIVLKVSNGPAENQQPHQGDQGSEPFFRNKERFAQRHLLPPF